MIVEIVVMAAVTAAVSYAFSDYVNRRERRRRNHWARAFERAAESLEEEPSTGPVDVCPKSDVIVTPTDIGLSDEGARNIARSPYSYWPEDDESAGAMQDVARAIFEATRRPKEAFDEPS